ncbi:uncharacterized protein LOC135337521 [Halichondria panicea]|uniref:uncharacterized protein LOC135337521 n=1 Tax=Halichondria panicea TaxID=6063 RepID=UPI00312B81D4
MKIAILVLVLAAVSAFAADQINEEAEVEVFVQHLMKGHNVENVEQFIEKLMNEEEETVSEQEELNDQDIDSMLAQMQEDDGDNDIAMLQELIAREQDPEVKAQWRRWRIRKIIRKVSRGIKKVVKHPIFKKVLPHVPFLGKAYKAYKCFKG